MMILSAKEEERTALAPCKIFHLTNVQRMITCAVNIHNPGDKMGECAIDYRNFIGSHKLDRQSFYRTPGEMTAQALLVFAQHAHSEETVPHQVFTHARPI